MLFPVSLRAEPGGELSSYNNLNDMLNLTHVLLLVLLCKTSLFDLRKSKTL